MNRPPQSHTEITRAPSELGGSATTVEFADGCITLQWREFRENSATRLMGLLMLFVPLGAIVLLVLGELDLRAIVIGVLAIPLVLVTTHVVMGGSTCLTITAAGVEVEARRPILGASTRLIPAPVSVRLWPLLATADRSKGEAPKQWWVAFRGGPNCTVPGEVVLVDNESLNALRSALDQAGIPGLFLNESDVLDDGSTTTCTGCGYDLTGITRPLCPECGRELTEWTMTLIRRKMPAGAVQDAEIVPDADLVTPDRHVLNTEIAPVPALKGNLKIHAARHEIAITWRDRRTSLNTGFAIGSAALVIAALIASDERLLVLALVFLAGAAGLLVILLLQVASVQRRLLLTRDSLVQESSGRLSKSNKSSPSPILVKVRPAPRSGGARWIAEVVAPGQDARCSLMLSDVERAALRSAVGYSRVPGLIYREPAPGRPLPATDCAKCRYNLVGLERPRCPECGEGVPAASMELLRRICAAQQSRGQGSPSETTLDR